MFGTQQLQQPQQQFSFQQQAAATQTATQPTSTQQFADSFAKMAVALTRPSIYGDERDNILAKLNQLLAFVGCGKGFCTSSIAVDFTPDNPFCRFKTIGYNQLCGNKNEDGLVAFTVRKGWTEISNKRQEFIDGVFKIMGSKPNLSLNVESIRPMPNDKENRERCEVIAFITEKSAVNDARRRIPALESHSFFGQPTMKVQLEQLLQVIDVAPRVDPPADKLDEYLNVPRQGLDWTVWTQAQRDNPDPSRLIPWPIMGFSQLRERQAMQGQEAQRQGDELQELFKKIEHIEQRTSTSQSRLDQLKVAEDQLSHRVLKIMGYVLRRSREGHALDANEESLHGRLENVFLRLNGPLQIKGRLSELLSHVRNRNFNLLDQGAISRPSDEAAYNSAFVDEVKPHLKKYQDGLEKLVEITQTNLKDLDVMDDAMKNKDHSMIPRK